MIHTNSKGRKFLVTKIVLIDSENAGIAEDLGIKLDEDEEVSEMRHETSIHPSKGLRNQKDPNPARNRGNSRIHPDA